MNTQIQAETLNTLNFDNRFTRELPADPETENYRRQVSGACYSRVQPTEVAQPKLVAYAHEVAELLDLTDEMCESETFAQVFVGNRVVKDMDPDASC